jgi:cold-inducible RNA-binding protein
MEYGMNKLFVGNLPFVLTEQDLEELFARFGRVVSVKIPLDRESGRKRGFAFIEMESQQAANEAIIGLNNRLIEGRNIAVLVAKPKAA